MRFQLLGPLQINAGDRALALASSRQKTIVAALLLGANRPVSAGRLIDLIWDGHPPATAREQVHICVSRLRKTLAAAGLAKLLRTVPSGYAMQVEGGELDLHVSDQLVLSARHAASQGRLVEAVMRMRSALRLWSGEPLADVGSAALRTVALRLSKRKIGLLEERMEYELRLGLHRQVMDELSELAAQHPLRERLQLQLMRALQGSGRRTEALQTYRDVRQRFVEDLGLEPGAELRNLHREILRGARSA